MTFEKAPCCIGGESSLAQDRAKYAVRITADRTNAEVIDDEGTFRKALFQELHETKSTQDNSMCLGHVNSIHPSPRLHAQKY